MMLRTVSLQRSMAATLLLALCLAGAASAQAVLTPASPLELKIWSAADEQESRAQGRKLAEAIKTIYGRSAGTPKHQNFTLYDLQSNDFQVFMGGFQPFQEVGLLDANPEQGPIAAPSPICNKEERRGSMRILITCPDWPAIRRITGATMFPAEKGVQVFVRSSDAQTAAFEITIRYRKNGSEVSKTEFASSDPKYDSGAGWLIGEAELLSVDVSELRRSASVSLP